MKYKLLNDMKILNEVVRFLDVAFVMLHERLLLPVIPLSLGPLL